MKIYQARYDQTHSRFGPRAGSQCVCNCFMYIHALHLKGAHTTLGTDTLDQILTEGAYLDTAVEATLKQKRPGERLPVFRLGEEVPNIITSSFGKTAHALSRPFNGTAETRDLDGYTCYGIFDFLFYAYQKPRPVYVVVTVNALARAVILLEHDIFVFDPHASDRSRYAAVYQCDSLYDVVMLLTYFGTRLADFYYDALFVYMIDLSIQNVPESEINGIIISLFRDPDIALPVSALPPVPDSPVTVLPSLPAPLDSTPKKTPEKRKATPNVSHGGKKKPTTAKDKGSSRVSTTAPYNCANALAALTRYERLITQAERETHNIVIRAPPTSGWILFSHSGLPFDETFLTDRMEQIVMSHIEHASCLLNRWHTSTAMYQQVRQLRGFSEEIDRFLSMWLGHALHLLGVYETLKSFNTSHLTPLQRAMIDKLRAVFIHYSAIHGPKVINWVQQILKTVEKTNYTHLAVRLLEYAEENPLDVDEPFVCLRQQDFSAVVNAINGRRQITSQQQEQVQLALQQLSAAIYGIDSHDLERISFDNKDTKQTLSKLDSQAQTILLQRGNAKITELQGDLKRQISAMLQRRYNQIISGSLPVEELQAMQKRLEQASNLAQEMSELHLCDVNLQTPFKEMHEQLSYLITGHTATNSMSFSDELLQLRSQFTYATQVKEDTESKIHDLMLSIETAIQEPTTRSSNIAMAMVQEQLNELQQLGGANIPEIATRLDKVHKVLNSLQQEEQAVRVFVHGLNYDNLPNDQTLKRQARLSDLLREDDSLHEIYIQKILDVFNTLLDRVSDKAFPKPQVFDIINSLINQLPQTSTLMKDLHTANAALCQLSKQLEALAKVPRDKRLEALTELVQYFVSNGSLLVNLMNLQVGKTTLPLLYERLKMELQDKHVQQAEAAWLQEAKKLTVTSADMVERFLQTAPSSTAADLARPDLQAKLRAFLEQEAKKQEEERKTVIKEQQGMVTTELARITDAVKAQTLSVIPTFNLGSLQDVISSLGADGRDILEKFNRNLLASLSNLVKLMEERVSLCIQDLLSGQDTHYQQYQEDARTMRQALTHIGTMMDSQLSQETLRTLSDLVRRSMFIEKCQLRNATSVFSNTDYAEDYKRYKEAQRQLDMQLREARMELHQQSAMVQRALHQPDARITPQNLTVGKDLPDRLNTESTGPFQRPVFQEVLKQQLEAYKKTIKDETELMNTKLKSENELRQAKLTSLSEQWSDLVTKHKMDAMEVATPDAKNLIQNPLEAMTGLLAKAYTQMSYLDAQKVLNWALLFLHDAYNQIQNNPGHPCYAQLPNFPTLIQQAQSRSETVSIHVNNNASCENFLAQHESASTATDREAIQAVETAWATLEAKRVAGGEARYKKVQEALLRMKQSLSDVELQDTLATAYYQLLNSIQAFAYSLDFQTQLQKIRDLKARFSDLIKQQHLNASEEVPLPMPHLPGNTVIASPLSFAKGLAALERYVLGGYQWLTECINRQPLVCQRIDDIPAVLPSTDIDRKRVALDRLKRLSFSTKNEMCYEVVDVFGLHQLMSKNGVPIHFVLNYGNVFFKYMALNHDDKQLAKKFAQVKNLVTGRYKVVTVNVAVAQTLKTFWSQISQYDLKPLLSGQTLIGLGETNSLVNLKIFIYIVVSAWNLQLDVLQEHRGPVIRIPIDDLCIAITTFYPEYIYGIVKHPIQNTLSSLVRVLKKDIVQEAINNVTQMPPVYSADEIKGFCINPKIWSSVNLSRVMWDQSLIRQLCDVGPRKNGAQKLWQYAVAIMVFPQDLLQCLWLELRPKFAEEFATLFDFFQALFVLFTHQYDITRESNMNTHLATGEPIVQTVGIRRKDHTDKSLLDIFIETDTAIDYVLGSWVFGIPVCCAIYVSEILNGSRLLLARHIEYTVRDADFIHVQRAKDLNLNHVITQTWTNTPLEQCWFQAQIQRIKDHLRTPLELDFIPLVIYNAHDKTVHSVIRPPTTAERDVSRIMVENPFPTLPLIDVPESDLVIFDRVPINTDFLREDPPPVYRQRGRSSGVSKGGKAAKASSAAPKKVQVVKTPQVDRVQAEGSSVDVPEEVSDDEEDYEILTEDESYELIELSSEEEQQSLPSVRTFVEPVFRQTPLQTIVRREDVTTVSPTAASSSFPNPPMTTLTQNVVNAIQILRSVRVDLQSMARSVNETINRLRFLYLL
ncbi:large tegument protein [Cercopithecine betaherpesvirus 5]|uniref:Large tegument protein n=1 Tax=Simian cytomegalovirus (strain Colburn) TaxID=50292 RepID=G8XTV3_SCMVC|nr:large tegument protein [Cercopithecine betaherpesvirus 5]